jgi:Flp pilus assembly protein TadG|tara:strand:- start:61 stop:303 length:243 start_codon:yes stop_codon:yes gene_type:complete
MIIKPLATESAVTDAAITAARVVRLVNSNASTKSTITIAGAVASSFTLLPNSSEIVEKDIGAAINASGGTVTGVPVAFNI